MRRSGMLIPPRDRHQQLLGLHYVDKVLVSDLSH
jgi:hypothetical protein